MKATPSHLMKAIVACLLSAFVAQGSTLLSAGSEYRLDARQAKDQAKDQPKQNAPSKGEQEAAAKVQSALDVPAKVAAAGEFVKKYPKSLQRTQIVTYVAREVEKLQDGPQRIAQLENLLTVFKEPGEADIINRVLIEAYLKATRFDEAFSLADKVLAKHPDDIATLWVMTRVGVDQAHQNNSKFAPQSAKYGEQAIQVIESGKKPDNLDEALWTQYQTKWLPQLYQWAGMLSMISGSPDVAKKRLEKALSLEPLNPVHYYLLGSIANDEYEKLAVEYQKLGAGPLRDAKREMAEKKMDEVVDVWSHTLALAEGDAQYQQLYDAVLKDVQTYYKYRHGSTDGMQQLIDKYKKPATVK